METSIKIDLWKIFTVILGCLIMPLGGWVWSMNVEVAQLRNDMGDLERQVETQQAELKDLDKATRTLIKVENDVKHIRSTLGRIESLVTK